MAYPPEPLDIRGEDSLEKSMDYAIGYLAGERYAKNTQSTACPVDATRAYVEGYCDAIGDFLQDGTLLGAALWDTHCQMKGWDNHPNHKHLWTAKHCIGEPELYVCKCGALLVK